MCTCVCLCGVEQSRAILGFVRGPSGWSARWFFDVRAWHPFLRVVFVFARVLGRVGTVFNDIRRVRS